MWQDELFAPSTEPVESAGGERVTLFQSYLDIVDWADPAEVARAVRVFAVALRDLFRPPLDAPHWDKTTPIERLRRLFARDGYTIDDTGHFHGGPSEVLVPQHLNDLRDATVILQHLHRIDHAVTRAGPPLADPFGQGTH
jgi:hypothetical protein